MILVNIIDVAKKTGFSTATVSRYFNNPEKLKDETRKKIEETVRELDFHPNSLARGLITSSTNSIGIIIPDINNVFYPTVIRGIQDNMLEDGYTAFISNTDDDIDRERMYINTYLGKRVDGIIFLGTRPIEKNNSDHIVNVSKRIPVVVISDRIDTTDKDATICNVYSDEEGGAFEAVKYLVKLGHKKIAFITSSIESGTYYRKMAGYKRALQHSDIGFNKNYVFYERPYAQGGYNATKRLLKLNDRPTAVFAISDQMALGVIKGIHENDLSIPGDISLIGFSGVSISKDVFPELTTIDQEPYEMGEKASKMMMSLLKGEEIIDKNVSLKTILRTRSSCGQV